MNRAYSLKASSDSIGRSLRDLVVQGGPKTLMRATQMRRAAA